MGTSTSEERSTSKSEFEAKRGVPRREGILFFLVFGLFLFCGVAVVVIVEKKEVGWGRRGWIRERCVVSVHTSKQGISETSDRDGKNAKKRERKRKREKEKEGKREETDLREERKMWEETTYGDESVSQ